MAHHFGSVCYHLVCAVGDDVGYACHLLGCWGRQVFLGGLFNEQVSGAYSCGKSGTM